MDIKCGMTDDQFNQIIRLARGSNMTLRQSEIVTMITKNPKPWDLSMRLRHEIAKLYVKFGVPAMAAVVGLGLVQTYPNHRKMSDQAGQFQARLS